MESFDQTFESLGVEFCLNFQHSPLSFVLQNKKKRVEELGVMLTNIARSGIIPRDIASSLAGKLQFASGYLVGSFLRPAMKLLRERANGVVGDISEGDRLVIETAANLLSTAVPRRIASSDLLQPVLIFTDGSSEGDFAGVGAVVIDDHRGDAWYLQDEVPNNLRSAWGTRLGNIIGPVEALAVLWVRFSMADRLLGRRVIFFVDNESVRVSLIAGRTTSRDVQNILNELAALEAAKPAFPWYARVPSSSNLADGPSRGSCEHVVDALPYAQRLHVSLPLDLVERLVKGLA